MPYVVNFVMKKFKNIIKQTFSRMSLLKTYWNDNAGPYMILAIIW